MIIERVRAALRTSARGTTMNHTELLTELERLPHASRIRRMVDLGQRASADPTIVATLTALEAGDVYERSLALHSCYGSRDGAHVLRALADPSRLIQKVAGSLLPLVGTDEQVQAAYAMLRDARRRKLVQTLRRRRRFAIIDTLLQERAAQEGDTLSALLPFGSAATAARLLPQALATMNARDWRALAHLQPTLAAAALTEQARAVDRLDPRLLLHANAALPGLADTLPDAAVALAALLLQHAPPHRLVLQPLVNRRPAEMVRLLQPLTLTTVRFEGVVHRLAPDLLIELNAQGALIKPFSSWNGGWFQRLAPDLRATLYDAFAVGWRDTEGMLDPQLVALLPGTRREAEGRRHLHLPTLAARPLLRLRYAAFLPWDEAHAELETSLRNPDAELRALVLATLAEATRYDRSHLSDLLELLRARPNEQDPVRLAALTALASLPPARWQSDHLPVLSQILRAALDATDLSANTASAAERLLVALMPFHPEWSIEWTATLVRERGYIAFSGLERRLSDDDVRRLAPLLMPVLRSWETREREWQLISAAQSLGRRLRVFDDLVTLLERLIVNTKASFVADQALALLAAHRPDRLALLVPALLGVDTTSGTIARILRRGGGDPSWITRSNVYTYLHLYRQDLLTPFLGQHAYRGRFSTGKTRFVLPLNSGFFRWTAAQQRIYAATLGDLISDSERDTPAALSSIERLAELPAIAPDALIALASDTRPVVRDAALRALGRLDAGQGITTLIAALDDERGRIAIYALRQALLEMPPDVALPLLRAAPLQRVTVAKEVIRLIGELKTDDAYADLVALDRRDLQRDVRVALHRALWDYPQHDETWAIFGRAAVSADAALARSVIAIPAERLTVSTQERLASLFATLLDHPDPTVRVDVLQRCATAPLVDRAGVLATPLLRALESPIVDEREEAGLAISATYLARDAALLGTTIGHLIPNRRALASALQMLGHAIAQDRVGLLPVVRAVLDALAADPLTAPLQVGLAAQVLPWDDLAAFLSHLAETGNLHAGTLAAAIAAIEEAGERADARNLSQLERPLATSADPNLRRLALAALVASAEPPRGWTAALRERLESYRGDPAPLVAASAQFTFPSEDTD